MHSMPLHGAITRPRTASRGVSSRETPQGVDNAKWLAARRPRSAVHTQVCAASDLRRPRSAAAAYARQGKLTGQGQRLLSCGEFADPCSPPPRSPAAPPYCFTGMSTRFKQDKQIQAGLPSGDIRHSHAQTDVDELSKAKITQTDGGSCQDSHAFSFQPSTKKSVALFKFQEETIKFLELLGLVDAQRDMNIRSWLTHDYDRDKRRADMMKYDLEAALNVAIAENAQDMHTAIRRMKDLKKVLGKSRKNDEGILEKLIQLHGEVSASVLSTKKVLIYFGPCSRPTSLNDIYRMEKKFSTQESLWSYACFGHVVEARQAVVAIKNLAHGHLAQEADGENNLDDGFLCFLHHGSMTYYRRQGRSVIVGKIAHDCLQTNDDLKVLPQRVACQAARGESATHIWVRVIEDEPVEKLVALESLMIEEKRRNPDPPGKPFKDELGNFYTIDDQYIHRGTLLKNDAGVSCKAWNPANSTHLVVRYNEGRKQNVLVSSLTLDEPPSYPETKLTIAEHDLHLRRYDVAFPNYVLQLENDPVLQDYAEQRGVQAGVCLFTPRTSSGAASKIEDISHSLRDRQTHKFDVRKLFELAKELDVADVLLLGCKSSSFRNAGPDGDGDTNDTKACLCGHVSVPGSRYCSACGTDLENGALHTSKKFDFWSNLTDNITIGEGAMDEDSAEMREISFWRPLKEITCLKSLKICDNNLIGVEACRNFEVLASLTSLRIGGNNDIYAAGCQHLKKLKSLTNLEIGPNSIGVLGCLHLKDLTALKSLAIGDGNGIQADGCKHLKRLINLTSLDIGPNNIGAMGCLHLKELELLSTLNIGQHNNIGPDGCRHLADLKQLESLAIAGYNSLGGEGCECLKQMQRLTSLSIGRKNGVGQSGCEHLKCLEHLTYLRLGGSNKVEAAGCEHLQNLRHLRVLILGAHNHVGGDGLQSLRSLEPTARLSIKWLGNGIGDENYGLYQDDEEDANDDEEELSEVVQEDSAEGSEKLDLYSSDED